MRIIGLFFICERLTIPEDPEMTHKQILLSRLMKERVKGLNGSVPACCFFFLPTAAPMTRSSSSSDAPERSRSLSDTSEFPNKHT